MMALERTSWDSLKGSDLAREPAEEGAGAKTNANREAARPGGRRPSGRDGVIRQWFPDRASIDPQNGPLNSMSFRSARSAGIQSRVLPCTSLLQTEAMRRASG